MKSPTYSISEQVLPLEKFLATRPGFTMGRMREWIKLEKRYRMRADGVVYKVGKLIYIDVGRFDRWFVSTSRRQN